jgi:hypothetical protein
MKQWYDKDTVIREFKSGEKVFVLFLLIFVKALRKNCNSAPTPTSLASTVNLYSFEKPCVVTCHISFFREAFQEALGFSRFEFVLDTMWEVTKMKQWYDKDTVIREFK